MKVTIAPCAPARISGTAAAGKVVGRSPLLRIAEAVCEDCQYGVTVEVLDAAGNCEAILGDVTSDDDVELF